MSSMFIQGVRGPALCGASCAALIGSVAPAHASAVAAEPAAGQAPTAANATAAEGDDEIVVTAQRRAQRRVDVPISVAVVSGEDLAARRVSELDDLSLAVPGLAIQSGPTRRVTIRGIGNVFGNASLVGVYLDEADVTSVGTGQLDLNAYDLNRVEVLRGPQGTLYGAGSAGGTVRFITNEPDLDGFGMRADMMGSITEGGEASGRINAVLNLPLVTDRLGLRIVGTYDHEGGWIDQPGADRTDINDQNLVDVRVRSLWRATDDFSASALFEIHRNTKGPNLGADRDGNFTQVFGLTTSPEVRDNHEIYNLTLAYQPEGFRILNSASYISQYNLASDYGSVSPSAPSGFPRLTLYVQDTVRTNRIFVDELRLGSSGDGPAQWTVGAFYKNFHFIEDITAFISGTNVQPAAPIHVVRDTRSEAWAVFGDFSYRFFDRLTLGAGIRYFEDHQTFRTTTVQQGSFDAFSPRFYASYKFGPDTNLYASAGRGFRSGGFNGLGQPPYDPETLWTYELGFKFADRGSGLSGDVAVFHSDYSNYQINGLEPPFTAPIARNAGDARVRGIEWAFEYRPAANWYFAFSGNVIDSEFTRITSTATPVAVGDNIDFMPKYQLTLTGQRDLMIGDRPGFIRLDYTRQGRETYRQRNTGPWYLSRSSVIDMLNASAALNWRDNLRMTIFVDNLLNERGYLDPFTIQATAARARPRTFGISFGFDFR